MEDTELRVALFFPALSFGGIENVMLTLAAGFLERGVAVDMVPANAQGEFRDRVPPGARLFDLRSKRVALSLPGLVAYLRAERPDALISAPEHANVIALWARRLARSETRIVIAQHNIFSENMRFAYGVRGRIAIRLARRTYPQADACIAVSQGVAADLAENVKIDSSKIHSIYNPVAVTWNPKAPIPHAWLAAPDLPVILGVGRLTPEKGFATLIAAFAGVRKQRPARLIILGEGPERPSLEKLLTALGLQESVVMPGYVANPIDYMGHAAVFVLPSLRESFSVTLVEALSTGAPVVSTDCHGPREILESGRHGLLVPVGDRDAMANAIAQQLEEGKREIPSKALRRFSRDTVVDAYLEVIEALRARVPSRRS